MSAVSLMFFSCTELGVFSSVLLVALGDKQNIRKPRELSDKIFANVTQSDVLPAHTETNMR